MRIERQQDVTPAVLDVMAQTCNPHLREIMISLVTHLHGFVRDVRLTDGRTYLHHVQKAPPYPGAKPSFLITGDAWDDGDWLPVS